ncbi:hypothetical protein NAI82_10735 [Oxalobacter sp. JAC-2022]|uniref:hypothetical protein n=1 Tax=Oxalobacter aliiformigenes TaxID=2946593 RepID=UPI0022AF79DE|nr:hypothetical protein [Oxalobacter aliiformigenes]MCZ4065901.1 hypothetical protein [Oxalobacter aliiformigenes]
MNPFGIMALFTRLSTENGDKRAGGGKREACAAGGGGFCRFGRFSGGCSMMFRAGTGGLPGKKAGAGTD